MGLPKYGHRRDETENELVKVLRAAGIVVRFISSPGVLDLLCSRDGKTCLVDAKTGNAKLTQKQEKWLIGWEGTWFTANSVEQLKPVFEWFNVEPPTYF